MIASTHAKIGRSMKNRAMERYFPGCAGAASADASVA